MGNRVRDIAIRLVTILRFQVRGIPLTRYGAEVARAGDADGRYANAVAAKNMPTCAWSFMAVVSCIWL